MSQNKSLQSKMPLAMGLAFVAFTTQFGGGFASGAQIYQYFINYGIWCLILPAVTQGSATAHISIKGTDDANVATIAPPMVGSATRTIISVMFTAT